jgi:hypothetical protein
MSNRPESPNQAWKAMSFQMSSVQVEALLSELCVVLGFCLPNGRTRLRESPPTEVDAFSGSLSFCRRALF